MSADLNADSTVPVNSERLKTSVKNGATRSATTFNWGTGIVSATQLLSGSRCMRVTTSSIATGCSAVSDAVVRSEANH